MKRYRPDEGRKDEQEREKKSVVVGCGFVVATSQFSVLTFCMMLPIDCCPYRLPPGGVINLNRRWTVDLNSIPCTNLAGGAAASLISSVFV